MNYVEKSQWIQCSILYCLDFGAVALIIGSVGPTWDNHKLRNFYLSLSPAVDSTGNTNYVI